ncbi:hypothetical protein MOXK23_01280 [Moraxella sp. K23]
MAVVAMPASLASVPKLLVLSVMNFPLLLVVKNCIGLNILTYQLHQAVQRVLAKFSICEIIYRKNVKKPMR